jgi:hypothetical protein
MNGWKRTLAAALAVGMACVGRAWADSNPLDDADSLTLTVSPNVNYSVDIDTGNTTLGLGSVDLGQSTFTVRPATVTFGGNITVGHEADLSAAIAGGWNFNAAGSVSTATAGGLNLINLYALFTSTNLAAAPSGATFGDPDGANVPETRAAIAPGAAAATFGPTRVGQSGGGAGTHTGNFECNSGAPCTKDMDSIDTLSGGTNSAKAHLWFFIRMPGSTSIGTQQSIQVTLTHTLGAGL